MLWLTVLAPAAAAATISLARSRRPAGAIALAGAAGSLAAAIPASALQWRAGWSWGPVLEVGLAADGLARLMLVVVPAIGAAVLVYAASRHRDDPGLRRLLALLSGFIAAMQLLVAADGFLALLLGWELVAACSWALIGHDWRGAEGPRAGQEAFVVTQAGGIGLVLAAGAAFHATGSLSFDALAGVSGAELHVVAAGVLVAALAKSAQPPFSPWLFSAMAGPTPVSALLHSATMVAAGAYLLARLVPLLAPTGWFPDAVLWLGMAGATAGGVVALAQRDLKRALAASTTAQYGLVLVAVGLVATGAAAAHLATHAAFKALLFLAAGVAIHAAGSGDLRRLRLGRALRGTAALFAIGAAALAAVPPLGGAFSKELISAAAFERGALTGALVTGVGLLSALYAGRLLLLAFGPGEPRPVAGPTRRDLAAMLLLGSISAGLGVLAIPPARRELLELVGGHAAGPAAWETLLLLLTAVVAAGVVVMLDRRGRLASLGLPERAQDAIAGWLGLATLGRVLVVTPVLWTARLLARFDDRVIDAGIRGVGRVSDALSRLLAWWGERGVEGVIRGVAGGTVWSADGSRLVDERLVDGAVEGLARGIGEAGARSRLLQTGLAHHYYVIVAAGALVAVALAYWLR